MLTGGTDRRLDRRGTLNRAELDEFTRMPVHENKPDPVTHLPPNQYRYNAIKHTADGEYLLSVVEQKGMQYEPTKLKEWGLWIDGHRVSPERIGHIYCDKSGLCVRWKP